MKRFLRSLPCVAHGLHAPKAVQKSEPPLEQADGTVDVPDQPQITYSTPAQAPDQHAGTRSAADENGKEPASMPGGGSQKLLTAPDLRAEWPKPPPKVQDLRVDPLEAGGPPVRVGVVVRPLTAAEKAAKGRHRVFVQRPGTVQLRALRFGGSTAGHDEVAYDFDRVYMMAGKEHAAQLYEEMVGSAVTGSFLKGVNTLVLAYGAAGTGKTSVLGMRRVFAGSLFSTAVQTMWRELAALQATSRVSVEVSFVELQRNQIRDLLTEDDNGVRLRECPINGPYIESVTELRVQSVDEVTQALAAGVGRRTTLRGPQGQRRSNCCHAIFTINLMQRRLVPDGRGVDVLASKLVFCDLAASEPTRSGSAAARGGKAAADAAHVSKSLLALGNVISAATSPRRNNGYVPYRDSLLTRILQDCPGKATHTVLLACVSAADICHEQTLQTLRFAERARSRNLPVMSLEASSEEAYLHRLLTVQQQERRTAMALTHAPAMPQLEWEGDNTGSNLISAGVEPVSSNASTSTAAPGPGPTEAVQSLVGPNHLARSASLQGNVPAASAPTARSSPNDDARLGSASPEGQQRSRKFVTKRRDSSRSAGSFSQGSSSGRSEATSRTKTQSEASAHVAYPGGLPAEPSTPDQVTTPPQHVQRLVNTARLGSGMTGQDVLPLSPLEDEMYRSVEAAIRQLNMDPAARLRKRSRAPDDDATRAQFDLSTD